MFGLEFYRQTTLSWSFKKISPIIIATQKKLTPPNSSVDFPKVSNDQPL